MNSCKTTALLGWLISLFMTQRPGSVPGLFFSRKETHVLANPHRFEMRYAFAIDDFLQYENLFINAVRWKQAQHGLSQHFICGIAEDGFRAMIPACNDAVHGLADDGVVGGLNDSVEIAVGCVGMCLVIFGPYWVDSDSFNDVRKLLRHEVGSY